MRTKDEIIKELHKNRQPGMYGGIPPDTKDSILIEAVIDIRDTLQYHLLRIGDLYSAFKEKD